MPLYLPHFNLKRYNTLASPVSAAYFVSVHSHTEVLEAIKFARERELPILVLGGGSNLVLYDDFPGLVVHMQLHGKDLDREDDDYYYVTAAAGENWHGFVEYCLNHHYWGLENLALIPGSVGAAPIQNIGAYGVELKDVFSELSAIDIQSGVVVTFTFDACQFGYRDSVFKQALLDKFIIISVTFRLYKQPRLKIHYPALASALAGYDQSEITPNLVAQVVCDVRRSKLPDPADIPNVGSFFKNPIIPLAQYHALKQEYPTIVAYPQGENAVKLAAGWLIDKAGWKGVEEDGVGVHAQQALVLINPSGERADKVLELAERIKMSIAAKFGVLLEQEPRNYPL